MSRYLERCQPGKPADIGLQTPASDKDFTIYAHDAPDIGCHVGATGHKLRQNPVGSSLRLCLNTHVAFFVPAQTQGIKPNSEVENEREKGKEDLLNRSTRTPV